MRVLFTCQARTGHLHPLVPLARALTAAGHEVAFATHASMAKQIEESGFRHLPAGYFYESPEIVELWREFEGGAQSREALVAFAAGRDFAGVRAAGMAADVRRILAGWPADLLVREDMELGGCVAAEAVGIPHAVLSITAAGAPPHWLPLVAGPLDELRRAHGLPPDDNLGMLSRYLSVIPFPPGFADPLATRWPTDHHVRPRLFDRSGGESLPDWIDRLPRRPTVYGTLGTVFNDRPDLWRVFVDALAGEPLNVILTVGRDQDPAALGDLPDNIRAARYIPQSLLFPRCQAVLTHGGSGTVMAALTHGLPLVVVPISADQPENATRCAALGVGRVVDPSASSAGALAGAVREAVRAVLADPRFGAAAGRMRQEIESLPELESVVPLLERLAVRRRPMTAAA